MKRGQVTIFIIVGILLIMILVLFFSMNRDGTVLTPNSFSPKDMVKHCVQDSVEDSVQKIIKGGGKISPSKTIMYKRDVWTYLCYREEKYAPCYNIEPLLELQVEQQIEIDSGASVQNCFNEMRESYENKGFEVAGGGTDYSVDLIPGNIDVYLKKNIDISSEGGSSSFKDFDFQIVSPIYGLIQVARTIVNSEAEYCEFEHNSYMLLYPKYYIEKTLYQDSKIYTITDRDSDVKFKFAVRSCAFGMGL